MGDSNYSGPVYGNRQGSGNVRHTFQFTVPVNATGVVLPIFPIIKASTAKPVIIAAQIFVNTLDGGTTPTFSLGTSVTATELISAASLAAANIFLPAANAVGKLYLVADTQLWYKTAAGNDSTGVVTVILDIATVNLANVAS